MQDICLRELSGLVQGGGNNTQHRGHYQAPKNGALRPPLLRLPSSGRSARSIHRLRPIPELVAEEVMRQRGAEKGGRDSVQS